MRVGSPIDIDHQGVTLVLREVRGQVQSDLDIVTIIAGSTETTRVLKGISVFDINEKVRRREFVWFANLIVLRNYRDNNNIYISEFVRERTEK